MRTCGKSVLLLTLSLASSTLVARADEPAQALRERITNGLPTQQYPSVGWLIVEGAHSTGFCSGTLIGCQTFLTAAHCICTDESGNTFTGSACMAQASLVDPSNKYVYFENAGLFSVSKVAVRPDFQFAVRGDVSVLTLSSAVTGIAPSPINTLSQAPAGTPGTIVGFGLSSGSGNFDAGIKRAGSVVTSSCSTVPGSTHVCWTYKSPLGVPGVNSDTCAGDSGGPLFADLGAGPVLAGVTSGGNTECTPTDHSFDADVFVYHDWIAQQAGGDLGTASCGGLPAAGSPGTTVFAGSGTSSATTESQLFTVDVPASASRLRVALNGEADATFGLYVKRGGTASTTSYDCKSSSASPIQYCEMLSPGAGSWSVLVRRGSGSGPFQVTATTYATTTVTPSTCVPSATTMCLGSGRFQVQVAWKTPDGTTGPGHTVPLTDNSGYLWFFTADNVEAIVKVLDACSISHHFWVFAGGLTNVQATITVTDTQTGSVRTYFNPQNTAFQPLQDTSAFACP
jgi:hypothetical protein